MITPTTAVVTTAPAVTLPPITSPLPPITPPLPPITPPLPPVTTAYVPTTTAAGQLPPATQQPTGLGTDPTMDVLAQSCYAGDMQACDDLYYTSPIGSAYESFAETCAGRTAEPIAGLCVATFTPGATSTSTSVPLGPLPPATQQPTGLGTDPAMDALAKSCYDGDMQACDDLYYTSPIGSAYESFAETCAGRSLPIPGSCTTTFVSATAPTSTVPGSTAPPTTTPITTPTTTAGNVPPPTQQPTGLGIDPALDALAQSCYDGDMQACDDLYFAADVNTAYEAYGDTCAGRQPPFSGLCTAAFGSSPTAPTAPTTSGPPATVTTVPTVPSTTTGPTTAPPTTLLAGVVPPPTLQPVGLGDDATLNALAQSCYDGDMGACDDLWRQSELDTAYKNYGDTCAGRQPPNTTIWCVDAFSGASVTTVTTAPVNTLPVVTNTVPVVTNPTLTIPPTSAAVTGIPPASQPPTGLGAEAALDALAQRCYDGDMGACDELFKASPIGSAYQDYGDTCAGRQPAGTFTYCRAAFPA